MTGRRDKPPGPTTVLTADGFYWAKVYGGDAPEVIKIENKQAWACGVSDPLTQRDFRLIVRIEPPG